MSEQLKEPGGWPPIRPSMSVVKAIEILADRLLPGPGKVDQDYNHALKLAILALRCMANPNVRGTPKL